MYAGDFPVPPEMTDLHSAATILQAASQMGVPVARVRGWLRAGAPILRPGQRGRGHAALVDVEALEAWLQSREQAPAEEHYRAIARNLVADIAAVVIGRWRARTDPGKLRDAGAVVAEFEALAAVVHERLGLPELPPDDFPASIKQIVEWSQHFRQSR